MVNPDYITAQVSGPASNEIEFELALEEVGLEGWEVLEETETSFCFRLYLPENSQLPALLERVRLVCSQYNVRWEDGDKVTAEDWANEWKKYYAPLTVGQSLLICPSWLEHPVSERHLILMDPGMAFGTGYHATTQSCLCLMERWLQKSDAESLSQQTLYDYGCGSGILSIAAKKLGVGSIVAEDIDPICVDVTRENLTVNGFSLADGVKVAQAEQPSRGPYPMVVANIVAKVLIPIAPALAHTVDSQGWLLLSGIIEEREEDVLSHYRGLGFQVQDRIQQEDWVAVLLRR